MLSGWVTLTYITYVSNHLLEGLKEAMLAHLLPFLHYSSGVHQHPLHISTQIDSMNEYTLQACCTHVMQQWQNSISAASLYPSAPPKFPPAPFVPRYLVYGLCSFRLLASAVLAADTGG